MKYEIGDLKNYVKIIGKKLGFFLWILINFKDDFLKFNFLFWLFSKKKHDYIFCSQSIIFKMHNFFCKHVWLIYSWIVNRWIVCREIARANSFFPQYQVNFIETSERVYLQYIAACEILFLWYLCPSNSYTLPLWCLCPSNSFTLPPRCPRMTCAITIANPVSLNNSIQKFF